MTDPNSNLRDQAAIVGEIDRRTAEGWQITATEEPGLFYLEHGDVRLGPMTRREAEREKEGFAHNYGEGLTAAERAALLERLLLLVRELHGWREQRDGADPTLTPRAAAGWLEYTEDRLEALEVALAQLNDQITAAVPADQQKVLWECQRAPVGAARHIGTGLSELRAALGNPGAAESEAA